MRLWEFIEKLSDEEIKNFLNQLDNYKDGLKCDYEILKNKLGYKGFDKSCLETLSNISRGSIKDGYQGFIFNEDIDKFYKDNADYLNQYLLNYISSLGHNSFEELIHIISNDMEVNWFLEDITLCDSCKVKRNISRFFAEDVSYNILENFEDYFSEKLLECKVK